MFACCYDNKVGHPVKHALSAKTTYFFLFQDEGESRYVIKAIVGSATDGDIGVENLSAAGAIAGETSSAYDEIVTISMVSARCVYSAQISLGNPQ